VERSRTSAYSALDVLHQLAGDPDRRQAFLLGFMQLAAEFGAGEALRSGAH
jgi:hypothetical protein